MMIASLSLTARRNRRSDVGPGTGMGRSLIRSTTLLHESGTALVVSRPGSGSPSLAAQATSCPRAPRWRLRWPATRSIPPPWVSKKWVTLSRRILRLDRAPGAPAADRPAAGDEIGEDHHHGRSGRRDRHRLPGKIDEQPDQAGRERKIRRH